MSDSAFIVGQRWVSNSEAELGLGLIQEASGRRIEVLFPAVAETRFYAANNAPLSRVIYSVGDKVTTREQVSFTVSMVQDFNECYIYQGDTAEGEQISIHEMDLDSRVHFNQPQDRLLAGQVDKNSQFQLRSKALVHQHELLKSPTYGLLGSRVQLLPHQLYIAQQVAERFAPRVLLADEVGLGKTIEAGMILHKQVLKGQVRRALIIVPDALLHQWLVEMLRRFNLSFTLIDHDRYDALFELNEGNPFDSAQFVLCGLNDLLAKPEMHDDVLDADWDMMIVDEAHHLEWSPETVSSAYRFIEHLSQQIPALLLLTATPEQLGIESHFARLRLLDPDKFYDLEEFIKQETAYQPISELIDAVDAVSDLTSLTKQQQSTLADLVDDSVNQRLTDEALFSEAKVEAIQQLLDRHGTGRVLYRNTREVVKGFPQRRLHTYPLVLPEALSKENMGEIIWPELHFESDWLQSDARIPWLVEFLKADRQRKVLLICANAKTALELEDHLNLNHGIRSAVFHENISLVNRDRAAAYFADEEEGAQCLVCSEIGSEGRNFQFAHDLVLFDLPVNPDLLEQRIGRLDRIGQTEDVQIHVPFYPGTAQSVLLDWYDKGMNAFEHVLAAGQRIAKVTKDDLATAMKAPGDKASLESLLTHTKAITEQTLEELQSGRHRLLERHSFNEEVAEDIVAEVESLSRPLELARFMDGVFDAFGVEQQSHSADSIIIEPGTHMQFAQFPGLPEDGLTATYKRRRALSREDMAFLTWEHPMVSGALDLVLSSELGNSAFCTLATDDIKAGTLLLEAIFVMKTVAERDLQIQRYIADSHLRVLVDERGKQYQSIFEEDNFNQLAGRIPRATAQELIRHARQPIETLVTRAKTAVEDVEAELKQQAMQAMNTELAQEQERLMALAKVNPNIRQQELDYLSQLQTRLQEGILAASLSLDAIRVAIVTEGK